VPTQENQEAGKVPFTTRLTPENKDRLRQLAAYEGADREAVINRILNLFFEATGPIPERKSLLETWPGKKPRKPSK
jgi:hypothetical protein